MAEEKKSTKGKKSNTEEILTGKEKKSKVIELVGDIVTAVILIFAVVFTLLTLSSAKSEDGLPNIGGYSLFSVQSDSMEPVFYTGDLLLIKEYTGQELKEGDIISFRTIKDGERVINTHRIKGIQEVSGIKTYTTRGDNTPAKDPTDVVESEIVGVYSVQENGADKGTRIKGLGKVIDVIKGSGEAGDKWSITLNKDTPDERKLNLSFLLFIILPLALIFLFQIYKFVRALNDSKKEKTKAELLESGELSEELKQKAIEEYLAKQAAEKAAAEKKDEPLETGETPEESTAEEVKEEVKETSEESK